MFAKRVFGGVLFSIVVILSILGLGFGIAAAVYTNIWTSFALMSTMEEIIDTKEILSMSSRAFSAVSTAFFAFCLLLCLFLLGSTVYGYLLAKRAGMSQDNLNGILRLFVISTIVLVGMTFRGLVAFLDFSQIYVPLWFRFGLTYIGAVGVVTSAFLVFIFLVFSGMRRKTMVSPGARGSAVLSARLLEEESNESEEMRPVPKAYEI